MECETNYDSQQEHQALYLPPKTFKQTRNYASRQQEVANIRNKFPNKIPVVVERYAKETTLPVLDKTKFLVPQELTMSQFVTILRNRMQLQSTMSFYLLRCTGSAGMTMASSTSPTPARRCLDEMRSRRGAQAYCCDRRPRGHRGGARGQGHSWEVKPGHRVTSHPS
ncbi:hypothetical protein O3P69_012888 [Scylla paramamosain]|uniref:Uncharacterized protein n=1 Tax=Scylla paramamosain TaxID=85552 RepID=A0AAW0TUL3_SCYPA